MITRTLLSFSYTSDIKSLSGFVKGGRDKVPKEAGEYYDRLIFGWAESAIKEHVEAVATQAKESLEISAREFNTPYYDAGTGGFECKFFNYNFSVAQSEEDFSECVFTGVLEVESIEDVNEIENVIDDCFEFTFEKAFSGFPKGELDLKELIYSLDDNKKTLEATFEFSYENDFSSFQLIHKEEGAVISVDDSGIEINFKTSEPISQMLLSLKDVNKKIFLATQKETQSLSSSDSSVSI